jgi:formylglycine-generating enzyme required for sulfatase activity
MIVVPAGEFTMGSPASEKGRSSLYEDPRHKVRIPAAFAVSRFEITFDEWNACVDLGGCKQVGLKASGRQPVNFMSWHNAQEYVAWISQRTGKRYRLLSEAEWEYAARAGSDKAYSWGDDVGKGNANCSGCGSPWEGNANSSGKTAPVGSFPANGFGLHDMHGNVYEWVEDCFHFNYKGAPTDGSAWAVCPPDEDLRVMRGGDYSASPQYIRSAARDRLRPAATNGLVGFRVARTLAP